METQRPLEQEIWSEQALLDLLGIEKRTLDALRQDKDFPYVRLTAKARVYLAEDVLSWFKQVRKTP